RHTHSRQRGSSLLHCHGTEPAASRAGGSARGTASLFQPAREELSAGTRRSATGCLRGGGGRYWQNAAGTRMGSLGSGAGRSRALRASLRDGGTAALPAAGGGPAVAPGGGKRARGPLRGPVAGRTVTPAAGVAGALSRFAVPH